MGNWGLALESAQQVLEVDKYFVKAIYVKAESLYNTCNFEHALIYYHRGQVNKVIKLKEREKERMNKKKERKKERKKDREKERE